MVKAQAWLQENFPTQEIRENLEIIAINNTESLISAIPEKKWGKTHQIIEGTLDFTEFINLRQLNVHSQYNKILKLPRGNNLECLVLTYCKELEKVEGLERHIKLAQLKVDFCPKLPPLLTFLDFWKQEIQNLKNQLAEYESQETASSSSETLNSKLQRKKAELQTALTRGRKSTAPLRKEIELLEKVQNLENRINDLESQEANYKQQIQQKEQQINQKQTELNSLNQQKVQLQAQLNQKSLSEKQFKEKSEGLEQRLNEKNNQVNSLQAQIKAWEEKMLAEREKALKEFAEEKEHLQTSIKTLNEQKDTFQKSADYLRETLKGTERTLEEIKKELAQAYDAKQSIIEEKERLLTAKNEELRQRNEGFKVVSERNQELQNKLSLASGEIDQLVQWISKLERASGEGDAFVNLKAELTKSQQVILELQEQLATKQPKSYWWVYVLIALVGVYWVGWVKMKKVLVWLILVAAAVYFWSQDEPELKPSLPPKNKLEKKPFLFKSPVERPNLAPKKVSPCPSDLVKSPEIKPFNLKPINVSWPSPGVSELTEEEKAQRKAQEQADYEWLLRNKTLREWHLEKKLSDSQYAVLSTKVNEELMESLEYFEGLLPSNWEWMVNGFKGQPELVEEWIKRGFSYEQAKDWVRVGLNPQDYSLTTWLRDIKKVSAEEVLNFGKFEELKKEFESSISKKNQSLKS